MPVTDQQARALAFLAAAARPHGAPRWDEAGIVAAIAKVRDRSLSAVTIAVMQAAEDRKAATPGVIPKAGPHWRDPQSAAPVVSQPFNPADFCGTCGKARGGCTGHEFVSVVATKRAADSATPRVDRLRAAREEATAAFCRHHVARSKCADCKNGDAQTTHPPTAADPTSRRRDRG